jgi:hypothetical protein
MNGSLGIRQGQDGKLTKLWPRALYEKRRIGDDEIAPSPGDLRSVAGDVE